MSPIKMYTAVFVSEVSSSPARVVNINASPNRDEAYSSVCSKHAQPGESLVALVPGSHADWSHTYQRRTLKDVRHVVDPFELPEEFNAG